MTATPLRLPAEWETQRATLLAWPTADSDWAGTLAAIRAEYLTLISTIAQYQSVLVLVHPGDLKDLRDALARSETELANIHAIPLLFNDTWCRDYGPIVLLNDDGARGRSLDFRFNAWGGKYQAQYDNRINAELAGHPLLADLERKVIDFELEGGAIECDGAGTLLINWHCLEQRHPALTRPQISARLKTHLKVDRVLGIDVPALAGDDTDGHIDTLARFISPTTIVHQTLAAHGRQQRLIGQLEHLRQKDGQRYQLIGLPDPSGFDPALPANYANFLLINHACLVPSYGVSNDVVAEQIMREALPDHEIILVPAQSMMTQFGGPHCATMHIPESQ